MARKVFYSFHYKPDSWRVSQVRQMGALEGNQLLSDNAWEEVTSGGEPAIKRWIDGQLAGKSCAVVLIGNQTSTRKWVIYEIEKAWDAGKGVVGVYIHNLQNSQGATSSMGNNPFSQVVRNNDYLSRIAKTYNPAGATSTAVYNTIKNNIEGWVEEAITIRSRY